ncbi:MAG: hypothetical protein MJ223_02680 [Mycoplasmoidaceae bacterium]|nr:hypothetical protein [Mycoplasmoidaceae bacterium]
MFKLFIPSFEYKGNKLLYLDVDTMANGDISLAFDINMDNAEICACHVLNIQIVFGNNSSYFNGGVFLINLQEVRKTNLFERALSYYLKYKPMTLEEAALNVNVKKLLFWPDEQRFNYQRKGIKDNTIIKTLC